MRTRGYTLLELLTVLVIISMSAAAAAPAVLDRAPRDPIERAATILTATLETAQSVALSQAVSTAVIVDPRTGVLHIVGFDDPHAPSRLPIGGAVRIDDLRPRLVFEFDPLGRSAGDSVVFWSPENRIAVLVQRMTGAVELRDSARSARSGHR